MQRKLFNIDCEDSSTDARTGLLHLPHGDVKAMRTTKDEDSYKHLENSLRIFKALEDKVDKFDYDFPKSVLKTATSRLWKCT